MHRSMPMYHACMPQDLWTSQPDPSLQLPTEVVQRLRSVIFGFDFFVTTVKVDPQHSMSTFSILTVVITPAQQAVFSEPAR